MSGYGQEQSATAALDARRASSSSPTDAPRVIYVNGLGDYDTHQGEATRHPALMRDLDAGLDTFFDTLDPPVCPSAWS